MFSRTKTVRAALVALFVAALVTPFPAAHAARVRNVAPVISGSPATTAQAGSPYYFRPTATDANGDTLTFRISGKPLWATFSSSTGTLSGTPGAGAVGTYANIIIAACDGKFTRSLPAFSITVSDPAPVAPANRAPVISGTPVVAAQVGQPYAFRVTASDPDGDALTYAIANKPAWATFETDTGLLYGTPAAGNVGTVANIVVSVSDGEAMASLPAFSITTAPAPTLSATLRWNPPTQNTDGSALTDLASYQVSYGTSPRSYATTLAVAASASSVVIDGLEAGTYYFAVKAVNAAGVASEFSNEATKVL